MFNTNRPDRSDLPTTQELLKSTGLALVIASGLLVAVVLPAEYGVDPTRIGSIFGLTEMGRVKRQLAAEAEAEAQAGSGATAPQVQAKAAPPPGVEASAPAQGGAGSNAAPAADRSDTVTLTLAPDQGAEIKLDMREGQVARYTWSSSGGKVNFDLHADRPGLSYHGYQKGSSQRETGELRAAFTGSHGWFWRNRTGAPVTITLQTSGAYSGVKRVV
jgi:hypothetical protein